MADSEEDQLQHQRLLCLGRHYLRKKGDEFWAAIDRYEQRNGKQARDQLLEYVELAKQEN